MKKLTYLISILTIMAIAFSCSKSEDANPADTTPGPKFLAVKSVINNSCASSGCHVSPSNAGGKNFESNANIVANGNQIKTVAVDLGTMPPTGQLSAADKSIITAWINAGGRLTD